MATRRDRGAEDRKRLRDDAEVRGKGGRAVAQFVQRKFLELRYMGSTRAIIGPGFQVRELLFGNEYASMRVTAHISESTQWRSFVASMKESEAKQEIVECVEIVHTRSPSRSERAMTVHLKSKHSVEPFLELMHGLVTSVDELEIVPVRIKTEQLITQPNPFYHSGISGIIYIKWATGVATGRAELYFANASAANEFVESYCMRQTKLPPVHLRLAAIPGDSDVGNVDDAERARRQSLKERKPWLPPCTRVRLDDQPSSPVDLFDEAKIDEMDSVHVQKLRFMVEIVSGLPLHVDEDELMEMVRPCQVLRCWIHRDEPPMDPAASKNTEASTAKSAMTRTRTKPLSVCGLAKSEKPVPFADDKTKQAGVRAQFINLERLMRIYDVTRQSPLWSNVDKPCGQPVRLGVQYTLRMTLAKELYDCFRERMAMVFAFAEYLGVSVFCDGSPDKRVVKLKFCCHTCDPLERVARSLENAVECEPLLVGSDFSPAVATYKQHKKLVAQVIQEQLPVCVRLEPTDKTVWIYGMKEARANAIPLLTALWRSLQREETERLSGLQLQHRRAGKPEPQRRRVHCSVCVTPLETPLTKLMACGHTFCADCIQVGIISSNQLPIRCPVDKCGCLVGVHEIVSIANDVAGLMEMAVRDYVIANPDEVVGCPKPGCSQLLSCWTIEPDRLGGHFIACDRCHCSYCLACAETTGGLVLESHTGMGCCEHQAARLDETVDSHVEELRSILSTRDCPYCETLFPDFDGFETESVGTATCYRLAMSSPDSSIAINHLRDCGKNPRRGSNSALAELSAVLREHSSRKLGEYLTTHVQNEDTRRMVLKRVAKDLHDRGIEVPADLTTNG